MVNERAQKRKHYIKKYLDNLMNVHNVTPQDLSFEAKVPVQNIYNIRNGKTANLSTYEALLNAFGYTLTIRPIKESGEQLKFDKDES